MSQFSVIDTPLADLRVVQRKTVCDDRGFLARIFCADELRAYGWEKPVAQINHTLTKQRGIVRGMHYQVTPYSEMKLVTCLRGEIWDVAVDLRKDSPTFLRWHSEKLSSENYKALLIPQGFAHGFQALTNDCELVYLHSAPYVAEAERGIRAIDPLLNIAWPLEISNISERDLKHPMIDARFEGVKL